MATPDIVGEQYSPLTGLVYIFNLIVGTGALTLPAAFHEAGWALSAAIIVMLAFMSYLTATFMIESMASANAMVHWKRLQRLKKSVASGGGTVSDELIQRTLQTMVEEADYSGAAPAPAAESAGAVMHSPTRQAAGLRSSPSHRSLHDDAGALAPSAPPPPTSHFYSHAHPNTSAPTDDESEPLISHEHNSSQAPSLHSSQSSQLSPELIERLPRNVSAYYNITEQIEMGKMASMFFNKTGRTLFYLCITIYLYGDLAIYGAAVAKSMRDVACTFVPKNETEAYNISDNDLCWQGSELSRMDAYRIALLLFIGVVGPFCFCNVQKTKYLQILTTLMRWLAFGFMVSLACLRLLQGQVARPPVVRVAGLPNLFGVCVYSFMCHHSLPSLVTPISRKKRLLGLLLTDYVIILCFYFLLAFTGIFAFDLIHDLYTLNFQHKPGEPWFLAAIHYFLSLFPVFTLSTNFPIIAITLRNNLKALFLTEGRMYSWCTRSCLFPVLALLPPVGVAFATNNLEFLVGITGSYAGAGIQYIVPAFLVYCSRKTTRNAIGVGVTNQHSSVFKSQCWVWFVQAWAVGCVLIVTWNHVAGLFVL